MSEQWVAINEGDELPSDEVYDSSCPACGNIGWYLVRWVNKGEGFDREALQCDECNMNYIWSPRSYEFLDIWDTWESLLEEKD